jgi:hypothetical protein
MVWSPHQLLLITDAGNERDWANTTFLASVLARRGEVVERVMAAPGKGGGGLLVRPETMSAKELVERCQRLRQHPRFARRLEGLELEILPAAEARALDTATFALPAIALFAGAGSPYNHLDVFSQAGLDAWPMASETIRQGGLAAVDVLVMPGGGWEFMAGQLSRLGIEGARRVNAFVEAGGCYLASCAGTHCVLRIDPEVAHDWHPAQLDMPKLEAESWLRGERHEHHVRSPGIGVIKASVADRDHPIALGLPPTVDCVYYNGPILDPLEATFRPILHCEGIDPGLFTPGEALFGEASLDLDRTAMAEACRRRLPAAGWQRVGSGWIIGFGMHPEFGCEPSLLRWGKAARMLVNAVEWVRRERDDVYRAPAAGAAPTAHEAEQIAARVIARLERLTALFEDLSELALDTLPPWLAPDQARATFGHGPVKQWDEAIRDGSELCRMLAERIKEWRDAYADMGADPGGEPLIAAETHLARARAAELLTMPAVEAAPQDLGFKGVIALLDDIEGLLVSREVQGHYQPYRAVAMSYLSAYGLLGATSLLLSASQALLERGAMIAALPAR